MKAGGEIQGVDTHPPTLSVTRATALNLANAGAPWNEAARGTLGAWSFGDLNQPPALLYNDYDGAGGVDYCALFTAANTRCGALIPGQRRGTTPGLLPHTGDIQLAEGDTGHRVTASLRLPATLTLGDTTLDLVWSVHHDPEEMANRVTVGSGMLLVDTDSRTSSRWIILRATTGPADNRVLVNDYHLYIRQGDDGLPNPDLRFTASVDTLEINDTHDFAASSASSAEITWSVSDDTLATIDASGRLTAVAGGSVQVTARVEADDDYRGARISHTVTLTLLANTLTLSATADTLAIGAVHDFNASSLGSGDITWSVTDTNGAETDRATIDAATGEVTAVKVGTVNVVATVAEGSLYGSTTASHTLTLTGPAPNLALTTPPERLHIGQSVRFTATREGEGALTWSIVEGSAAATIDPASGRVTAGATAEMITIQVAVAASDTHASATADTMLEIDTFADVDGDGLIEIYDLGMLHNMRHDLAGSGYKTAADADPLTAGVRLRVAARAMN